MDVRAHSFAGRLRRDAQVHIAYRAPNKILAILQFLWTLARVRPNLCYVLDMGFSGVLAAGIYRIVARNRMAVDTGDDICQIARSMGRGTIASWLTKMLEAFALSHSDRIVVRSHPHQQLLAQRGVAADVIPDGVDTRQFRPLASDDLRRQYHLDGFTVIGVLGSLIWNPRSQTCYGSELIDVVDRLRHRNVKGLIIGDGSGLLALRKECAARGLQDRIVFLGRIPYADLPPFLNLIDISLSTQTNDAVGQVRTTGKLPLYLATGRFVLASNVGEAAQVLPGEMLVPYRGSKDQEYPGRLSSRIESLLNQPEILHRPELSVKIAQTHFEYDVLAARLQDTIDRLFSRDSANPRERGVHSEATGAGG
jgi:glycosyltransferase involved in cell wall biosynthesis